MSFPQIPLLINLNLPTALNVSLPYFTCFSGIFWLAISKPRASFLQFTCEPLWTTLSQPPCIPGKSKMQTTGSKWGCSGQRPWTETNPVPGSPRDWRLLPRWQKCTGERSGCETWWQQERSPSDPPGPLTMPGENSLGLCSFHLLRDWVLSLTEMPILVAISVALDIDDVS